MNGKAHRLAAATAALALVTSLGEASSGPFDLVRNWSGGPWDYRYPWAGQGYPCYGSGAPYTWDQPFGAGQAGPYIWGAPFATPSLFLPQEAGEPSPEGGAAPGSVVCPLDTQGLPAPASTPP